MIRRLLRRLFRRRRKPILRIRVVVNGRPLLDMTAAEALAAAAYSGGSYRVAPGHALVIELLEVFDDAAR